MLFNSYEFIFLFLPITLVGFFALAHFRHLRMATAWLALTSLFFYGYWNPPYVILLMISVIGNFLFGAYLNRIEAGQWRTRGILWLGIAFNLGILGYYKYAGFFIQSIDRLFNSGLPTPDILLPLGISFYSFTQIAYLVDVYRSEPESFKYDVVSYTLFVVFFPQLIAGPILRHNELIPALNKAKHFVFSQKNMAIGTVTFILGLAKKLLIADTLSPWVAQVFGDAASASFLEAWIGVLGYTFQLYFDFSGYSDMAIGLGLMFNLPLPINFNSPYKATSMSDFWRRWHITLSHFLRDYLYIPLGGSRHGEIRRYGNLILTMLLGGLWHGAGWTFVIWGGLHGVFLAVNHAWRKTEITLPKIVGWGLTFGAVMVSWIFFRAATFGDAFELLQAMVGLRGISLQCDLNLAVPVIGNLIRLPNYQQGVLVLAILLGVVVGCPNTQELVQRFKPTRWWALSMGAIAAICLLSLNRVSEFLYFQF